MPGGCSAGNKPRLGHQQIQSWFEQFIRMDEKQYLVDCFINSVYIYGNKIILFLNYREGGRQVSLKELEGSDFSLSGSSGNSPRGNASRAVVPSPGALV